MHFENALNQRYDLVTKHRLTKPLADFYIFFSRIESLQIENLYISSEYAVTDVLS